MTSEAGPSRSGSTPDADTEAKNIVSQMIAEGYEHDDVAKATAKGGLKAGYAAYLDKYKDYKLTAQNKDGVSVRRSAWANAPKSVEYKRRQASFDECYLAHLKRAQQSPFDFTNAGPFLDLLEGEHAPRGLQAPRVFDETNEWIYVPSDVPSEMVGRSREKR